MNITSKSTLVALVVFVCYCCCLVSSFDISNERKSTLTYKKICYWPTCSPIQNDSQVLSFCEFHNLHMDGRCCVAIKGSLNDTLGIDLSHCELDQLEPNMFSGFVNTEILMLQYNPFQHVNAMPFLGLFNLTELYLPVLNNTCPGNDLSWEMIVNDTILSCLHPLDTCISHNLTCPPNSYCATAGPGAADCFCADKYYGYKCKRTGSFPVMVYSISTSFSIASVALSLWFVHRYNKKKRA